MDPVPPNRPGGEAGTSAATGDDDASYSWPKEEVKALKRALKEVPCDLDKNERFRRISALVGGGKGKKDCYDKYKQLKAEAKVKRASAESSSRPPSHARPSIPKPQVTDADEAVISRRNLGPDCTARPAFNGSTHAKQEDAATTAATAASSISTLATAATRTTSSAHSISSSTNSSWCSSFGVTQQQHHHQKHYNHHPQQQQQQQQQQNQRRRSTTSSSARSSVSLDLSGNREGIAMKADAEAGGSGGTGCRNRSNSSSTTSDNNRTAPLTTAVATTITSTVGAMDVEEVDVEDFCLDEELEHVQNNRERQRQLPQRGTGGYCRSSGGSRREEGGTCGREITEVEAASVRELVFGNSSKGFNDAWREQGFYFCGVDGLRYGLVQAEGGPCGVLAVVQAFVLEDLIFGKNRGCDWRNPGKSVRERSLVSALSTIIWRASDGCTACLALSEGLSTVQRSSRYKPDGVTERLKLHRVSARNELEELLCEYVYRFTEKKGNGVVLLVYSCLFTRGLDCARGDMDSGFGEPSTMMARHGYASQELVNLLLLGRAHSNVFDGQRVIGDSGRNHSHHHSDHGGNDDQSGRVGVGGRGVRDNQQQQKKKKEEENENILEEGKRVGGKSEEVNDTIVLTGVPAKGRVGFLTLFEAYRHVEVGDSLKTPELPVWVVCSESHYSVLFSRDPSILLLPLSNEYNKSETTTNSRGSKPNKLKGSCTRSEASVAVVAGRGKNEGEGDGEGEEAAERRRNKEGVFDIEYYDGLGRQDEVIRLTVDTRMDGQHPPQPTCDDAEEGLVPPIDLVIRTRWPSSSVDWNGTDPLL